MMNSITMEFSDKRKKELEETMDSLGKSVVDPKDVYKIESHG